MERELQYYKSKLDAVTGELIQKDYTVAQLSHESRQLQNGFKLLLAIGSEFYKRPELNSITTFCCESTMQFLAFENVCILTKTNDNEYTFFAGKQQNNDLQLLNSKIEASRADAWFKDSNALFINSNSKAIEPESDLCQWFGFPYCAAVRILVDDLNSYILLGGRKSEKKFFREKPLSETELYIFESVASLYRDLILKLQFDLKIEAERIRNEKQLQEYNALLEQRVEERTREITRQKNQIEEEKHKSDALLLNILPYETADELKRFGKSAPRGYDSVAVLFTDFVDFSKTSEKITPDILVNQINYYFSAFDHIITNHKLEKIKTIGDSYMCAAGIPIPMLNHAKVIVNAAMEIIEFVNKTKQERKARNELYFDIRVGIHAGPVVAGIVGTKKFAYDIWGDTVNYASRMESSGAPGKINVSGSIYELIKNEFECTYRGKVAAKGKGDIDMFFIEKPTSANQQNL